MVDLLLDSLPTVWAGKVIDPDFRHMIRLSNAYARKEPDKDPLVFAQEMCRRFYREPIAQHSLPDAYRALVEFYLASEPRRSGDGASGGGTAVAFDYQCDAPYIIAAFQQTYGIDLTSAKIHWWRFRALLSGLLSEECLFARIVRWRTADLTELDDAERGHYEQMRERFALPEELRGGAGHATTKEELYAEFFARHRH